MPSSSAAFGYPSRSDSFSLSGGSWSTIYPRSNLRELPLSRIARTVDALAASSIIRGTAATNQSVGILMLAKNNLTTGATIRLRLYSDASWTTQIYDSAATAWFGGNCRVWWGAGVNYTCRSFQIDITDTSNPFGYIDIGYLEVATSAQPLYSFQYGADIGFRSRTQKIEVLGGAAYFDRRDKPRTFSGSFIAIDPDALNIFSTMQITYDIDIPFIWLPHPTDTSKWSTTTFLARFFDLDAQRYAKYGIKEVTVKLEEVL